MTTETTKDTRGKTLDEVYLLLSNRIAKIQKLQEKDGEFSEFTFTIEELEEVQAEIRFMQSVPSDD